MVSEVENKYLNWIEVKHIIENHQMDYSKCGICELFNNSLDRLSDEFVFKKIDEDILKFKKIFCNSRCDGYTHCDKNFSFGSDRNLDKPFSQCKKYRYFISLGGI